MLMTAAYLLPVVLVLTAQAEEGREPMVAFHCGQPTMYQRDSGWVKDDSTGCLKDPADILNYCRKVFPSLDVRNVVEASEKVTVPNWCDFGHTMCNQQFSVLPFRCLVGPFQSDALLVPEHCIFDHIHDSKICTSYSEWNQTSFRSCHDRDMIQQSFAMLQPCGIDKFNGVEFVCCPTEENQKEKEMLNTRHSSVIPTAEPRTEKPKSVKNDDFTEYINQPMVGRKWNEHEYYVKARNDMRQHHIELVAKMMKDWASARQRVQDLKAIDPKASEKLNKEITSRFQKTYEAEEVESEMEKKQLAMLHQQRVQAELNEKKRRTLSNFMQAIDDYDSDSTEISKALKHYIKALQKDRLHTVNRFKHLLETDPAEADSSRTQSAEHLQGIDQQLSQALDMLDRVPKFKNRVMKQIADFLDSYHSIDASITALLLNPEPSTASPVTAAETTTTKSSRVKVEEDVDDEYEEEEEEEVKEKPVESEVLTREPEEDDYEDEDENVDVDDEEEEEDETDGDDITQSTTVAPPTTAAPTTKLTSSYPDEVNNNDSDGDDDDDDNDDEVEDGNEDTDDQVHVKHEEHVANMEKSYIHLKEPFIQKAPVKTVNSFNAAVPLGIAVGGITVFVVIIVGVIVMRRRARQRRPGSLGSLDLDPAASPEERHVASMQMNGYENPTYKYFEMNNSNA